MQTLNKKEYKSDSLPLLLERYLSPDAHQRDLQQLQKDNPDSGLGSFDRRNMDNKVYASTLSI